MSFIDGAYCNCNAESETPPFQFHISVVAEGVVDFAGVALQAEGQEECGPQQQRALQDAARHLHGNQGEVRVQTGWHGCSLDGYPFLQG